MNQQDVATRLKIFEGSVPHMYRCTGGEVTIGVGHAIFSTSDAQKLSWGVPSPSPEEVISGYRNVYDAPKGQVASYYANLSTCRMTDLAISNLLSSDMNAFLLQVKKALPNWDRYPDSAQQALFDMAYNLGINGLLKYPKMLAACDAGDWKTAAQESHRNGISQQRNQTIYALFCLTAGGVTPSGGLPPG
jgi:GH24 family phage-related lysozyme (muramidase)